jgi:hypothetical protein
MKYNEWVVKLNALNEKINKLTVWDDYAEMLQAKYDRLLSEEPKQEELCQN